MFFNRQILSILTITQIVCAGSSVALAQEEIPSVDEIVVTSNRVPVPLRRVGVSVSVIDLEDITAHGNLSLVDILRQTPAVSSSNNGGAGKISTMRIRGEQGFRTLTIFDGIRLSDPSAPQISPQLEHLLSSGVGRVEILRGPQGLAYGADAGGIVNITSPRYEGNFNANLDVQAGKFDTHQLSGNVGGESERLDYFLSATSFETKGFNTLDADNVLQDEDGYENTTIHGRTGFRVTENFRFNLMHRNVKGDSEEDNCFAESIVHQCRSEFDMQATRAEVEYRSNDFSHSLSYATTTTDRMNFAQESFSFGSEGNLNRIEYLGSARQLSGFDLVWGGDWEDAENNDEGRNNVGVYIEYLSDFSDRFFYTAGVRHDDNDDFGTNTSYRLSGAYLMDVADGSIKIKGSYGSGFRAPSPYEIQYNAGAFAFPPASNINLKQESSQGYEFGIEYTGIDSLRFQAVYFNQEVEDAIYFDLASFSGYLQDFGNSSSDGIELSTVLPLSDRVDLSANYTFNDTKRPTGEQRLRRPRHLANAGLTYYGMNGQFNVNLFYRLSRDSVDEVSGEVLELDDFGVMDLSINFNITDDIRLYGRLENALDEDYREIIGFNTPGRAAYIGAQLNIRAL